MKNQQLESCKDTFLQIAAEGMKICRNYEKDLPKIKEMADHFECILQERLKDFNPKIMVYGIYNSGKSTIMNALMGQKKAAMSDVPTTFTIDEYQWKEYTIFDTPGINAPKKDEEVSKAQLEKCDVIIFVMDTEGAFNLGKNYRELIDIIQSGKRLLIVLNNKSGFDCENPQHAEEIQKIEQNIYRDFAELYGRATPEELARKVKIIFVNALDALNARTDPKYTEEERDILLNSSNIAELEHAIVSEYGKASGFTILHELEIMLSKALDELSSLLKGISSDSATMKGKQTLCELQDLQDLLISKMADYVNDAADELDGDIYQILSNAKDEKKAQSDIQAAVNDWAKRVNDYLKDQIKSVSVRVDSVLTEFAGFMNTNVGSVAIPGSAGPEDGAYPISRPTVPGGSGSGENPVISVAQGYLLQKSAKVILPVITKLPWIGPVIGKVLGPLVPVIGPIIVAVSILAPLFGKSENEKRYEAELEAARQRELAERRRQEEIARIKQEIKDESRRISRKISSGILNEVRNMISACFEPALKNVQESIVMQQEHSADVLADLRKINDLKQTLHEKVSVFCNC